MQQQPIQATKVDTTNFTEDVVVTEVITFTKNHEVNRAMPYILQERGTIQVSAWNSFCDKLDDAQKPLREKNHKWALYVLGTLTVIFIIALSTGSVWFDGDSGGTPVWYYPFFGILTLLSIVGANKMKGTANKTVQSNLITACANMSNQDNNLTVSLKGDHKVDEDSKPENWYINIVITGMNIQNHEIQDSFVTDSYLEAYPDVPIAYATATATATEIPVAYATEASAELPTTPVDPLVGAEAPKKYVKSKTGGGGLTLNPKYKAWMTANGNPIQ